LRDVDSNESDKDDPEVAIESKEDVPTPAAELGSGGLLPISASTGAGICALEGEDGAQADCRRLERCVPSDEERADVKPTEPNVTDERRRDEARDLAARRDLRWRQILAPDMGDASPGAPSERASPTDGPTHP
jgi:hypothetical protein